MPANRLSIFVAEDDDLIRELGKALDHLWQDVLVERMAAIDQSVTGFAGKADAFWNTG